MNPRHAIPVAKGPFPPAPLLLRLAFKPVDWALDLAHAIRKLWRNA